MNDQTAEIAEIYARNTRPGEGPAVKASMLGLFLKSPITVWCDLHVDSRHRDPPDPYTELLFRRGHEHQAAATAALFGTSVTESFKTEEEGFIRVLELMAVGADAIGDMPVLCRPLGLEGRPDMVRRLDGQPSVFGSHAYEVIEIKSARHIRHHHILQAALYNRVLGELQGVEPTEFHLVNGDTELTTYAAADYESELDEAIAGLRLVLSGGPVPPVYGTALWPWRRYVDGLAIASGDVSTLPGVGAATRNGLAAIGLHTADAVAEVDQDLLTSVKGLGPAKAARISTSARAATTDRPVRRGPVPEIRTGRTEVFVDLEGSTPELAEDGITTVNYLIGALLRAPGERAAGEGEGRFVSFFADRPESEAENTRAFFGWASGLDDPIFYHWHHYERTHLKKMAERFSVPDEHSESVLGRMVDLSPITTGAFAFPTRGEGLKDIAQYLGYRWRQDDVNALASVALYTRWIESGATDGAAKTKILIYNEDDCRATMVVYDWLKSARKDAGA